MSDTIAETADKDFLRDYYRRQMEMSDWTTSINTAIEKKHIQIAKKALAEGVSIDFVKKITGLNEETIIALQNGE